MLGRRRGLKGDWLEVSSLASGDGGSLYMCMNVRYLGEGKVFFKSSCFVYIYRYLMGSLAFSVEVN